MDKMDGFLPTSLLLFSRLKWEKQCLLPSFVSQFPSAEMPMSLRSLKLKMLSSPFPHPLPRCADADAHLFGFGIGRGSPHFFPLLHHSFQLDTFPRRIQTFTQFPRLLPP